MSSFKNQNFIRIPDDNQGYNLSHFCIVSHYEDVLESVLVPHGLIKDRIEKMAHEISSDEGYIQNGVIALCVLKGGFKFFSDLTDALGRNNRSLEKSIPLTIEFIKVKSYNNDCSTDDISISGLDNLESLKGKNVLIVEDIIDTGKTMVKLVKYLTKFNPTSVRCASLLLKRTPLSVGYIPDYVGFETPDKFLVGYALDYNDYFRDLNHICVINEEGKTRFARKKLEL